MMVDTDVLTLFEGSPAQRHYFQSVLQFSTDNYVVTESFKDLCKLLESRNSREICTISGPRGVGKSLALAAVASLYCKERPCLLWSPISTSSPPDTFYETLKEVYHQFGMSALFCVYLDPWCKLHDNLHHGFLAGAHALNMLLTLGKAFFVVFFNPPSESPWLLTNRC